jgi:ketosteroid isomerase-like protein
MKIMRKLFIALAVSALACGSVSASEKTDVMAVVHKWVSSFNGGDTKTMISLCTDDAVVVDDFSPHVWKDGSACANWAKGYAAYTEKGSITEPVVTIGKTKHLDVDADYAYLVAPTTYAYKVSGKPMKDGGMVTMILHKTGSGWKITAWAWADQ